MCVRSFSSSLAAISIFSCVFFSFRSFSAVHWPVCRVSRVVIAEKKTSFTSRLWPFFFSLSLSLWSVDGKRNISERERETPYLEL